MRVAIASDDRETISAHFGRTMGFMIFDIEDNKITGTEYRENNFTPHARGGAEKVTSRSAPVLEALDDCDAVIANGMGRRILMALQEENINAVITTELNVKKAVDKYINGELDNRPDASCPDKHS